LLPPEIVSRLGEVGAAWAPDPNRAPLPAQPPQIDVAYDPTVATATSGQGFFAVDGIDDWYTYTVWESSGALPQAVTVDLGQVQPDVSVLNYVPRYIAQMGPSTDGAITSYNVYVSTDNATFTMVASGDWPASGLMKTAAFDPVAERYLRLEATAVNGTNAAATEIAVGAHR